MVNEIKELYSQLTLVNDQSSIGSRDLTESETCFTQEAKFLRWPERANGKQEYQIEAEAIYHIKVDTYHDKFNLVKQGQTIVLDQYSIFELDFLDQNST